MFKPILIGVAGAGTIGGLATGAYYLLKTEDPKRETTPAPKTLLQELAGDNFEALDTSENAKDNDNWEKLIQKYISESKKPNLALNSQITTHTSDNKAQNITAFKNSCKTLLEKISNKEEEKTIAKNWCNKQSALLKD